MGGEERWRSRSKSSGRGSWLRIRGCFQRSTQCSLVSRAGRTRENVRIRPRKEDSPRVSSSWGYFRPRVPLILTLKKKTLGTRGRISRNKRLSTLCTVTLSSSSAAPLLLRSLLFTPRKIWTRHSGMRRQLINASGFKTRWKIKG